MSTPPQRDSARFRAEDLQAFAARDWDLVTREKERWWAERGRQLSAEEKLRIGDMLRRHAQRLRPDWPSPEERRADLETHIRVSEALRRVPPTRSH